MLSREHKPGVRPGGPRDEGRVDHGALPLQHEVPRGEHDLPLPSSSSSPVAVTGPAAASVAVAADVDGGRVGPLAAVVVGGPRARGGVLRGGLDLGHDPLHDPGYEEEEGGEHHRVEQLQHCGSLSCFAPGKHCLLSRCTLGDCLGKDSPRLASVNSASDCSDPDLVNFSRFKLCYATNDLPCVKEEGWLTNARSSERPLRTDGQAAGRTLCIARACRRHSAGAQRPQIAPLPGGAARLRLSFVDEKLGVPPLLPTCCTHSVRFPPAQAQLGRLSNIPDISKLNLGL